MREFEADRVGDNFRRCLLRLKLGPSDVPDPPPQTEALVLPTTHTFGAFKVWDDSTGKPHWRNTWKEILLDDVALLSDAIRFQQYKYMRDEPRRDMPKARDLGLHHFVSAYLGIHDPYYARQGAVRHPPFGVFIGLSGEVFPRAVATRRDLASTDVSSDDPSAEFLRPLDGRKLAFYEAKYNPRHGSDFWHYWGSPRCSSDPEYHSICWSWFIEFHFQDRVPVSEFAALLWPHEYQALVDGGRALRPIGDKAAFLSAQHGCRVIPYVWSARTGDDEFRSKSDYVARHFVQHHAFPEDLNHG